jgi:hypothetical protein
MKSVHGHREYGRGRVLEMAESSLDNENKIAELSGGQEELELVVPAPSGVPSPETKLPHVASPLSLSRRPLSLRCYAFERSISVGRAGGHHDHRSSAIVRVYSSKNEFDNDRPRSSTQAGDLQSGVP